MTLGRVEAQKSKAAAGAPSPQALGRDGAKEPQPGGGAQVGTQQGLRTFPRRCRPKPERKSRKRAALLCSFSFWKVAGHRGREHGFWSRTNPCLSPDSNSCMIVGVSVSYCRVTNHPTCSCLKQRDSMSQQFSLKHQLVGFSGLSWGSPCICGQLLGQLEALFLGSDYHRGWWGQLGNVSLTLRWRQKSERERERADPYEAV